LLYLVYSKYGSSDCAILIPYLWVVPRFSDNEAIEPNLSTNDLTRSMKYPLTVFAVSYNAWASSRSVFCDSIRDLFNSSSFVYASWYSLEFLPNSFSAFISSPLYALISLINKPVISFWRPYYFAISALSVSVFWANPAAL